MEKATKQAEQFNGIYGHLLKVRTENAVLFTHSSKVYKTFLNNYQGVKLSKASVRALGKV